MQEFDCDLLVVGLGPVGDTLAALAKLQGLSVIAIDREAGHYSLPRAAHFSDEIMRIFQMIGITDRLAPHCREAESYQFLTAKREVLLDFKLSLTGKYGWAESYAIYQPGVEAVLRDRLKELGVEIRLSTEFQDFSQDLEGVTTTVKNNSGEHTIRSKFMVGCDGASSLVRESIGSTLFDYKFDEPWLVIDALVEPGTIPVVGQQICDPKRPITHVALSERRFRWECMMKPGETSEQVLEEEFIKKILVPWNMDGKYTIERKAVYRFHGLVAEKWRDGRVVLAGDSAHQMPPFAGQGMCSGIRDAANLAWKLTNVVSGNSPESILDTYQEERDPHVRSIIELAISMGKLVCIQDEEAAAQRDAGMLAQKASGEQPMSLEYPPLAGGITLKSEVSGALLPQPAENGRLFDDLFGLKAALIGRNLLNSELAGVVNIDLDSPPAAPFSTAMSDFLESVNAQAVLVRPDKHIFGTGSAKELLSAWENKLN